MDVCTDCDIAYNDRKGCPLCRANDGIKDLEKEIERLKEELNNIEV